MYLKEKVKNTIVIEKSEFICYLKRCNDVEEFKEFLNSVKKYHYDATHHCSAYISKDVKRSNDDGEPSGTAGMPILNALEKRNMEDTGAVVVRYFGGIKLGAGGLIRAYSNATLKAIDIAKKVEKISIRKYELKVSYEISSRIDYYLRNNTQLVDTIYDVDVTYIYATNDDIEDKILEYTKGIRPVYHENIDIEVDV
ncbi:MAG: YigZ family protein [Erysipelotrichaceae bacterium]|nr:YigZ family protein [Erysipelotrichaceae bacterium]